MRNGKGEEGPPKPLGGSLGGTFHLTKILLLDLILDFFLYRIYLACTSIA